MALETVLDSLLLIPRWYLGILAPTVYGWKLYRDYDRLKDFKGPRLSYWTSFWLFRAIKSIESHTQLYEVCQKHGSIARVGPNQLITSAPELLYRMSAARSPYTKGNWCAALRLPPGQNNIFSQTDEKAHNMRKAQMADGYSGKTNPSLEPTIDKHVQNMIGLILTKYISTAKDYRPMDLARNASFFTMDVITDLAFAKPFGNLSNDEDMYRYIQSTEETLPVIMTMSAIPALAAILQNNTGVGKLIRYKPIQIFAPRNTRTGHVLLMLDGVGRKYVHDRFMTSENDHYDMISSFIAHGVNENDLIAESLVQILAGADTTATAIRATLLHVITRPATYARLRSEIDPAAAGGRISSPVIRDNEAQKLPYLQAVIKEGLRIWPPAAALVSKVVPAQGDSFEIDGKKVFIPGGTRIGLCVVRNKKIFGADPEVFRPERWLINDASSLAKMHKTADLVFGYGEYQCLGRPVALMELNKVFVSLLRNFDIELVNTTRPWTSGNAGLWIQNQMWVRVTERADELSTKI